MMQDDNDQDRDMGPRKEAYVIWGRPEIPKLFASSHYSQKLLKNHPFFLKKAICLARWEQDPMNEILNLWSPIMSENQALNIELHPLQKQINQARLLEKMEEVNIQTVNNIGIDINLLIDHEHMHNQLQFLSGLGPRKAQRYI
jgi:transcription elongation factor SPT6